MAEHIQLFNSPKDICEKCKKLGSNLISPCGNTECTIRYHQECLKGEIENGHDKCDKCAQPIIVNKIQKFKLRTYCNRIFTIIATILIFLIGAITPGLLIFGTIVHEGLGSLEPNVGWIITGGFTGIFSMIIGVLINVHFVLGFSPSIYTDAKYTKISNILRITNIDHTEQHFIITLLLIGVVYMIILICHFVGFLILKFIFGMGNLFDFRTFDAGLIFFTMCALGLGIIHIIRISCKALFNSSLEEETTFGTKINI